MTRSRRLLNALLPLLIVATVLILTVLGVLLIGDLLVLSYGDWPGVLTLPWTVVTFAGYWFLTLALVVAWRRGPLCSRVSSHLSRAGQWLFWSPLLLIPTVLGLDRLLTVRGWHTDSSQMHLPGESFSPDVLLSMVVSVTLPLLLMALSGWLDEGRASLDRQRTTI
jgi:ABC-type xylose transport system permease subunit